MILIVMANEIRGLVNRSSINANNQQIGSDWPGLARSKWDFRKITSWSSWTRSSLKFYRGLRLAGSFTV